MEKEIVNYSLPRDHVAQYGSSGSEKLTVEDIRAVTTEELTGYMTDVENDASKNTSARFVLSAEVYGHLEASVPRLLHKFIVMVANIKRKAAI